MAAETQMMPLMQAKAKRLHVLAEKKEEKHNNEDDDDDEEHVKGGGVPKWYKHHKAVWEVLFGDPCSSGHGEWPSLAVEHVPARYLENNWFLSMCDRNKDIVRMLDLKHPPEELQAEVVVDLCALPVNE